MTQAEVQALLDEISCLTACLSSKQLVAALVQTVSSNPIEPVDPEPAAPSTVAGNYAYYRSDMGMPNDGVTLTGTSHPSPSAWVNQSDPSGLTDYEALSGRQPGYTAAGPNGKPAIVWADGTDKWIGHDNPVGFPSAPFAYFILVRALAWTNNRYIWSSANTGHSMMLQNGSTPIIQPFSGAFGTGIALPIGDWVILTAIYNGASSVLQINNDAQVATNPGANNTPIATVLGNFDLLGSNSANFELAAMIIHTGVPDAAARTAYKTWLAWYGGLTI